MSGKYPTKNYSDGILVRIFRQSRGLSQEKLAKKLKISTRRLKKIESDEENIVNGALAERVAGWMGIPAIVFDTSSRSKKDQKLFAKTKKLLIDVFKQKSAA